VHYRREGQGPPVVLSHALGCNLDMWDDVAAALADHSTVIRYDTRSHGESEVVTAAFSLADLVSDAVRLIDDLHYEAISWVGLSMGGMIGQGLAIAHPGRVKKLVLANTASRYPDEARRLWTERARIARAEGMPALADLIMTRYFSPAFRTDRPDDVARFRDQVLAVDAEGYAACCEAIRSLAYYSELDRISCPTLVIAGGADAAASPALAEEITNRVRQSRLEVIEGAGHLSAVEYPETFARLVLDFL
jgi:3-oxoadipate enol-lactonase